MNDLPLPDPILHLPYEAGPFRPSMGLTAVPEAAWLAPDAEYHGQVAQRRTLLAQRRPDVLAVEQGAEPLGAELLAMLSGWLTEGGWFTREGDRLTSRLDGTVWDTTADDPLAVAGALVQEDFCLLVPSEGSLRLVAAVLCFPARWRLAEKMGRLMGSIHGSVPIYAAHLHRPVDRFLTLLKPGRLAARLNWSLLDDPALYQPTGHGITAANPHITAANAGETLFLRVERQTFRRLPASGAVVFAIHTYVTELERVTARPAEAARLAEAVRALPPEMERYKSLLPFRDGLLAYLDDRAAGAG
jgi:hypothetical protein